MTFLQVKYTAPPSTGASNVSTRSSGRPDLLSDAIELWRTRADKQPSREEQIETLTASIRSRENLIEKYLRAFETGTMPEEACGPRVRSLSEAVAALRAQREQLVVAPDIVLESDPLAGMDFSAFLRVLIDEKEDIPVVRALLQILVEEVRADGRTLSPTFRIPPARA